MGPEKYIKNYIGGNLSPAGSGAYLEVINPANGKAYAQAPHSDEDDLQYAIEAAERAFPKWAALDPELRFRLLMRLADILDQELQTFARAESTDTGKPLSMASSVDIPRAQECIRFYAAALLHPSSQAVYKRGGVQYVQMRQPLGIVACFPDWTYPLQHFCAQVIPALAAGNCVIAHPSRLTPMTAFLFAQACMDAGVPPGVLSIICGKEEELLPMVARHPKIAAISYSGSPENGATLTESVTGTFKKLSLDLGAKNPSIIFKDCDFDQMIIGTLRSTFSNNGQSPYSTPRIYVARELYEPFKAEFVKRTQFLKIGDPFSSVTDLGALISRAHLESVLSYLALAEVEGGAILCGGKLIERNGDLEGGYFLRPTLIEGLRPESRTNQEEILGPLATIAPFDTTEEAIRLANSSPFRRSACIWTRDIHLANQTAEALHAGMVWINSWMSLDPSVSFRLSGASGNAIIGGQKAMNFFTNEIMTGSGW